MGRPNLTNFASTTLAANITTTTATTFSVASTTGALFPSVSSSLTIPYQPNMFVVAIDSELILCSARSSDTFTVYQYSSSPVGRGWNGTTAATHTAGATVVLAWTAGKSNEIFSVLADSYNPDVPSWQAGGLNLTTNTWDALGGGNAPSIWDDEFDSWGGNGSPWTVVPLPTALGGAYTGATLSWGSAAKSTIVYTRNDFDVTTMWVTRGFAPNMSHAFSVTAKLSQGGRLYGLSPNTNPVTIETNLMVSDQSAFSSSVPNPGNAVSIQVLLAGGTVTGVAPDATNQAFRVDNARLSIVNSGVFQQLNWALLEGSHYLQLSYDGANTYFAWIGDGLTWKCIGQVTKSISQIHSLGFRFYTDSSATNSKTQQTVYIDWVRVVGG